MSSQAMRIRPGDRPRFRRQRIASVHERTQHQSEAGSMHDDGNGHQTRGDDQGVEHDVSASPGAHPSFAAAEMTAIRLWSNTNPEFTNDALEVETRFIPLRLSRSCHPSTPHLGTSAARDN